MIPNSFQFFLCVSVFRFTAAASAMSNMTALPEETTDSLEIDSSTAFHLPVPAFCNYDGSSAAANSSCCCPLESLSNLARSDCGMFDRRVCRLLCSAPPDGIGAAVAARAGVANRVEASKNEPATEITRLRIFVINTPLVDNTYYSDRTFPEHSITYTECTNNSNRGF